MVTANGSAILHLEYNYDDILSRVELLNELHIGIEVVFACCCYIFSRYIIFATNNTISSHAV